MQQFLSVITELFIILIVCKFNFSRFINLEVGFTGFTNANFVENLKSDFHGDISFFVVFGVFFPTACGVLAGVNMSGDLKEPSQNIPEGSVAALGLW